MSNKTCYICGEKDPSKFYGHKRSVCGTCHNKYTLNLGREKRQKAITLLGGQCKVCGYKKYQAAFDIHHLDPKAKDPNFASMRGWSWERIERELKGCILLCKCCHAAVHSNEITIGA